MVTFWFVQFDGEYDTVQLGAVISVLYWQILFSHEFNHTQFHTAIQFESVRSEKVHVLQVFTLVQHDAFTLHGADWVSCVFQTQSNQPQNGVGLVHVLFHCLLLVPVDVSQTDHHP